jgi:16S rRNA (guanine1207-N2)-methyltransferase
MPSSFIELLAQARSRIRPPVLIAPAAPRLVADLVVTLGLPGTTCFQFDLFQAERLRDELREIGEAADVLTGADLWEVTSRFATVLLPSPPRGERELKRDLVEQSLQVLDDGGKLVVLSPVPKDQFYPDVMKKTFGKIALESSDLGTVLWSIRHGEKPRRRHEISFHVREGGDSLIFVSRPGVFGYGRLDEGARALTEVMQVRPGDTILDLGCGIGAVGIIAARRAGTDSQVTFVDSHCRAVALAELNARANGLTNFTAIAASRLEGLPDRNFDLVLANPPYYAQHGVARLFVEGASSLLVRGGRLYLVTKQADIVGEIFAEQFGEPEIVLRRGYAVLCAVSPKRQRGK